MIEMCKGCDYMSNVSVKEIQYKNFGRCVEVSNELVRVVVTLDFGPRIVCYSFLDGENIMYEDTERKFTNASVEEIFGEPWYLYGGHRLWTSPEALPRTYYADNDAVDFEFVENGVHVIQKTQKVNQYQCEMVITLSPDTTDVTVKHRITNRGLWDVSLSIWGVSSLSADGVEIIPQPTFKNGCYPNRTIALWPFTKIADKRVTWGERYILLRQDRENADPFKFGMNSQYPFAVYLNHGDVFVMKYDLKECGTYPDGGSSFETYTNRFFLEMESLGEYKTLAPGESTEHCEYWSLAKGDVPQDLSDEGIDKFLEKYNI